MALASCLMTRQFSLNPNQKIKMANSISFASYLYSHNSQELIHSPKVILAYTSLEFRFFLYFFLKVKLILGEVGFFPAG